MDRHYLLICFYLSLLLLSPFLDASPNKSSDLEKKTISGVYFETHVETDQKQLTALLTTKPGDLFSKSLIRESMKNLFLLGLFSDIQVKAVPRDEKIDLVYILRGNRFIKKIKLEGRIGVSRRKLNRVLDRYRFARHSEALEGEIEDQIGAALRKKGYYLNSIESRIESGGEDQFMTLIFQMDHGPRALISDLKITGHPDFFETRIRSKCQSILSGSPYSEKHFEKAQRSLLALFQDMNFLLAHVSGKNVIFKEQDNTVELEIEIQTGPRIIFSCSGSDRERKRLLRKIPLKGAGSFSPILLQEGEENIKQYFVQKGYRDVEVRLDAMEEPESNILLINLEIDRNMPARIDTIKLQGNRFISDGDIRKRMDTKENRKILWFMPEKFIESALEEDIKAIKALYLVNGYPEAQIEKNIINLTDGKVTIELTIDEGAVTMVEEVHFEGNQTLDDASLLKLISLKPGERFTEWEFEKNRSVLQGTYVNEGFRQARVRASRRIMPVEDEPDRKKAFLTFYIEEGPRTDIHRVITRGNFQTKRKVVERELTLNPGDPLSQAKILESQQNLYERRIFKRVRIFSANPGNIHHRENLVVEVEEGKPLFLNFGVGFDTEEKLRGLFSVTHNNLFGNNWVGSLGLKGSAREARGTFSFQYPYLFERKVDSLFSAFAENTIRQGFKSRRIGSLFQLVKEIGQIRMVGSYNYEDIFNYNMEIDESDLNRFDRTVRISSFIYYLVRDSRDNPVDSTRGILNSFDVQYAAGFLGPGSGADFFKFFTQHIYYKSLTEGTVLATALRVGLARGLGGETSLPISERFFAGGGTTIRSLPLDLAGPLDDERNPLGGNAMLLGNVELRQSILSWLGGVAFFDIGNVFSEVNTMRLGDIRYCSGVGLRLKTPVGPVRLDVGFNLDKRKGEGDYEIFLSLGQTF